MIRVLIFLALVSVSLSAFHACRDPAPSKGKYVGPTQECAALVQTLCGKIGVTSTWKKGLHVKEKCKEIPRLTAIATFLGPGGKYDHPQLKQHTAIFDKCEPNGIRVWDQWRGTPLNNRVIPWAGSSIQYSGNNYWTILK